MNVLETVIKIAENQKGAINPEINEQTKMIDDLGFDSLDGVEFVMQIEDEYDGYIPDADAEKWVTVGDVVKYIETTIQKPKEATKFNPAIPGAAAARNCES